MAATAGQPLLVYDRIDANRRRTRTLLVGFAVLLLPFMLYVALYVTEMLTMTVLPMLMGWEAVMADPALTIALACFVAIQLVVLAAYLAYRRAAERILRVAGAREPRADEITELERVSENLCIGAGLPTPRMAVIDSPAINALSTGLEPADATIAVTSGALDALDRRELEGVVAHELSQIGNRDTRLGTVVAGLVRFMMLPWSVVRRLLRGVEGLLRGVGAGAAPARFGMIAIAAWCALGLIQLCSLGLAVGAEMMHEAPLIGVTILGLMLLPLYIFIVTPLGGVLMMRAISREHVHRADADAVLLTRLPAGLARALAKMSAGGNAIMPVSVATASLYVVDPRPATRRVWGRLARTHPPVEERLATLARLGGVTQDMLADATASGLRLRESRSGT